MAHLGSLWIGDRLGEVELASLNSILASQNQFTLFSYGPISNLPSGVELQDARQVYPNDTIIRHRKSGSSSLHADLFRYQMVAQTGLIWVDLDMLVLKKFDFPSGYVFGYETAQSVGNSVVGLPKGSDATERLIAATPALRGLPQRYRKGGAWGRYWKYRLQDWAYGGLTIDQWPWGALGPDFVTETLAETSEIGHAQPVDTFYHVPIGEAWRFGDVGALSLPDLPAGVVAMHMWGHALRRHLARAHAGRAPKGSVLAQFL